MATNSPEVLAVPAEALPAFYDHTEFRSEPACVRDAVNIVRRYGQFYLREWAEQTESVRQVIPCVIVRNGPQTAVRQTGKEGARRPPSSVHAAFRRSCRRRRLER